MNEELLSRLDALARVLGTTIEKLWPVIVAHERVQAVTLLVVGVCFLVGGIRLAYYAHELEAARTSMFNDAPAICAVVSAVLFVLAMFIIVINVPHAFFPEAAALKEATKLLR